MNIIGHDRQRKELKKLLLSNSLSHALLFTGMEGIGKSLVARELAGNLLCTQGEIACGTCQACKTFQSGNQPDYLYVTDEKTIKVQHIKEVTSFMVDKPLYSDKKVVIIDHADRMNPEAQNKLLKTFEEPPSYGTIILVTHNPNSLLETVKSRAQRFTFSPLTSDQINDLLGDRDKGMMAIKMSRGSVKRALEILSDDRMMELGTLPKYIFSEIIKEDEFKLIKLGSTFEKDRDNIPILLDLLLTWIRDISIVKSTSNGNPLLMNEKEVDELRRQGNHFDRTKLMTFIKIIEEGKLRIRHHVNPVIVLTYCLVQLQEEYNEYRNRS